MLLAMADLMDQLRIAIVGLRFGAHICDEIAKTPGLVLHGLCDLDAGLVARVGERHPRATAYASLDALLADPMIEAVGIFSGPNGRAGLIRRCLLAGKDVMTTKPFERDPVAAATVLIEARRLGRVVHLNSPCPGLADDIAAIQAFATGNDLGRPVQASFTTYNSYDEQADSSWYDDPQQCPAAPIFRLGIYGLHDLIDLLGEPAAISISQSRIRTGRPTADAAQMLVSFTNGAQGCLQANLCSGGGAGYPNSLSVLYERGAAWRNPGFQVDGQAHTQLELVAGRDRRRSLVIPNSLNSGAYRWDRFLDAVRARQPNEATYDARIVSGVRVIAAMAAAQDATMVRVAAP